MVISGTLSSFKSPSMVRSVFNSRSPLANTGNFCVIEIVLVPINPVSKVITSPETAASIASLKVRPAPSSSKAEVTVRVMRISEYPSRAAVGKATGVSISPVVRSRSQSPPLSKAPVKSSEAATSAPVSSAKRETKSAPSSPAPTSQPYRRISPSGLSDSPQRFRVSV